MGDRPERDRAALVVGPGGRAAPRLLGQLTAAPPPLPSSWLRNRASGLRVRHDVPPCCS
ncbi:hypothetical protein SGPA1_40004 [Streptomyces misionensis JCM 4497]